MRNRFAGWAAALLTCATIGGVSQPSSGAYLPRYDHILIVVEENKDFEQIIGNPAAPYLNRLAAEGTLLTRMFARGAQ